MNRNAEKTIEINNLPVYVYSKHIRTMCVITVFNLYGSMADIKFFPGHPFNVVDNLLCLIDSQLPVGYYMTAQSVSV